MYGKIAQTVGYGIVSLIAGYGAYRTITDEEIEVVDVVEAGEDPDVPTHGELVKQSVAFSGKLGSTLAMTAASAHMATRIWT